MNSFSAGGRTFRSLIAGVVALIFCACSLPNLEPAECSEARVDAGNFYSFHFANDMKFSKENLDRRAGYLAPEFFSSLQSRNSDADVFTSGTGDLPKAFRVGACRPLDPGKVDLEILLFWRDDVRSEQRPIHAEMVKHDDKWLLKNVSGQ